MIADARPYFPLTRHGSDPVSNLWLKQFPLVNAYLAFHLQILLPVSPVSPLLPASRFPFCLCIACPRRGQSQRRKNSVEVDVSLSPRQVAGPLTLSPEDIHVKIRGG